MPPPPSFHGEDSPRPHLELQMDTAEFALDMVDMDSTSGSSDDHENEAVSEPNQDDENNSNSMPGLMTEDELIDGQVSADEIEPKDTITPDDAGQPYIQWQDLEYVRPVCDTLLCAICKTAFSRPVTTVFCGHTFCFSCLDKYLTEKCEEQEAPCPMCRSRLRFMPSTPVSLVAQVSNPCNRIIDELLDKYIVRCPNNFGACGWEGPRSSVEKHVRDDCEYTLVPCVEMACLQKTVRGSAFLRRGCLHRKEQCCYCHLSIDMSREYEHLNDVCLAYKAPCDACGKRMERGQLSTHTVTCWETVAICDFANDGCSVATTRRQIARHRQSCIYGAVRRLDARLARSESVAETMRRENQQMRQELQDTREDLERTRRKYRKLRQELQDNTENLVHMQQDQETLSKVKVPGLISSFSEFEKRMSDLAIETRRQNGFHSQFMNVEMAQWKQEIVDMQGQIGGLVTRLRRLVEYQNRQRQSPANGLAGTSGSATEPSPTGNERESRPAAAGPRSRASSNEPRPSL